MSCIPRALLPGDLAACDRAGSFLQSGFWGSFKARFGWTPHPFLVEWDGERNASPALPLLVMRRALGPGISFAYVPWGPELPWDSAYPSNFPPDLSRTNALAVLAEALRAVLPRNTAFIRFDPPWYTVEAGHPEAAFAALGKPFSRAAADIQPPDTVIVDLSPAEASILEGMKPKWRYNIRLAEKKGVTVERLDEEGLPGFYRLFRETSLRDGIAIHRPAYYETLFSLSRTYPDGGQELGLYLARHEGEDLASVIVLFRGAQAVYLYGASANHKRNLMAPYALQWRAIRDAKAKNCRSYDLFGIPPNEDPAHPMAGLYRFKTGFGGQIIHRPGSWDYPCRPLAAGLFRAAESVRKGLRDRKKAMSSRLIPSSR